jgi:sensor histidine kinase YesM
MTIFCNKSKLLSEFKFIFKKHRTSSQRHFFAQFWKEKLVNVTLTNLHFISTYHIASSNIDILNTEAHAFIKTLVVILILKSQSSSRQNFIHNNTLKSVGWFSWYVFTLSSWDIISLVRVFSEIWSKDQY